VILVLAVALATLSVLVCGGSLEDLAHLQIRGRGAIAAALALQILIISIIPKLVPGWLGPGLQLVSYGLAVYFLVQNRHIPWLWLVGLGGLSNLAAIGANGGVMPASPVALSAAGRVRPKGQFLNSTSLPHPHLAFLGDNFSVPHTWPLANVFSIGDIVLAAGALLLLHSVCASRPMRAARQLCSFVRNLSTSSEAPGLQRWVLDSFVGLGERQTSAGPAAQQVERLPASRPEEEPGHESPAQVHIPQRPGRRGPDGRGLRGHEREPGRAGQRHQQGGGHQGRVHPGPR